MEITEKKIVVDKETVECKRCLLTNKIPGVVIKDDGLCSVCNDYDHEWGDWKEKKKEREETFVKLIEDARSKKRLYDVLVPVSGGKDSIYIMYLLKKKYNLKCLAVTWDNGFLSDTARENIKNACEILDIDHIYYGLSKQKMIKLYRYFFLKTGFFCPVCMRGIDLVQARAQLAFNIPLAVRGTSRRTEEHVSNEFFMGADLNFLENVLQNSGLEEESEALLWPTKLIGTLPYVNMPDFIEWNYNEIFSVLTNELKWTASKKEAEHSDCIVANIVDYVRLKKYPVLIPEMLRFSKLVTCGQLTREEALNRVNGNKKEMVEEPKNLNWFLTEFGISETDFHEALKDPTRHLKYLSKRSRIARKKQALKKLRLRMA